MPHHAGSNHFDRLPVELQQDITGRATELEAIEHSRKAWRIQARAAWDAAVQCHAYTVEARSPMRTRPLGAVRASLAGAQRVCQAAMVSCRIRDAAGIE